MSDLLLNIRRSTLGIALFAAVTSGLIAVTQVLTKTRIASNQEAHQARALYEILPASLDERLHQQIASLPAPELGLTEIHFYQAIQDQEVQAVIFPIVAADGYSGDIHLLVGIWRDGRVAGVRVLAHKETPGLGDKIELAKSDWILSFNDKRLENGREEAWNVRKEGGVFDAFTGATITPRAVVRSVARTLDFYQRHQAEILQPVRVETTEAEVTP
ncbi:electron transport complex subunit RsxG [Nitrincola tapanii]|uniref:Ion-translocating oxidoreductase complex subunit G n=1 Tax=Nitrincola tapanii TaxID=1708751 RepID=A0A5A9W6V6_9GAMM|nr:electron transport complex subunit RsxG [Nitrincola tapanii]KAA0875261.1 electron transport complex subunit RsxG [Nitrincola tapanii]